MLVVLGMDLEAHDWWNALCLAWTLKHTIDEMFFVEQEALEHMSTYICVEYKALEHMKILLEILGIISGAFHVDVEHNL